MLACRACKRVSSRFGFDGFEPSSTKRNTSDGHFKNHTDTENISVVALSSLCTEVHWREKAIQVGCDNCIAKPIDFAELIRILRPYFTDDRNPGLSENHETK